VLLGNPQHDEDRKDVDDAERQHRVGDVDAVVGKELGARLRDAESRPRRPGVRLERDERLEALDGQLRTDEDQRCDPEDDDEPDRSADRVDVASAQRMTYRVVPTHTHTHREKHIRPVFHRLPEPNRAWLLVVYFSR